MQTPSDLRNDPDLEGQICEILGINPLQGVGGSMRIEVAHDEMRVTWDGFVRPNEEQRDKVLEVIMKARVKPS